MYSVTPGIYIYIYIYIYISDIVYLLNKSYEFLTQTGRLLSNTKALDLCSKHPGVIIFKVDFNNPSVIARSFIIVE